MITEESNLCMVGKSEGINESNFDWKTWSKTKHDRKKTTKESTLQVARASKYSQ